MAGSTTWHAHVRIEKNGKFAEYKDLISAISMDGDSDERGVVEYVTDMIINAHPYLKGGRTIVARAKRK